MDSESRHARFVYRATGLLVMLVLLLAALVPHIAYGQRGADISPPAAQFAAKAAAGGLAEVEMAKLAQKNAASAAVRDYAERMLADHGQANEQLRRIARIKGITLPAQPEAKQQAKLQELAAKRGAEFDVAYVEAMKQNHEEDVRLFESAAAETFPDPELRGFAMKLLPVLRQHLEMVDSLASQSRAHLIEASVSLDGQSQYGSWKARMPTAYQPPPSFCATSAVIQRVPYGVKARPTNAAEGVFAGTASSE